MKKSIKEEIVRRVTKRIIEIVKNNKVVTEASGFDGIFKELKKKLENIEILPDNIIDASKYKEHEIIDTLKSMGYVYKKPMGSKLHFFNKETSISLYLIQNSLKITLMP
jgi:hypothetical protein